MPSLYHQLNILSLSLSLSLSPSLSKVQTWNQFDLISNWSDPLSVPRNDSVTENCTLIVPETTTNTIASQTTVATTEEVIDEGLPSYVYGAIGAGAGALLALLVCLCFTMCACVYWRQRRRTKQSLEVRIK